MQHSTITGLGFPSLPPATAAGQSSVKSISPLCPINASSVASPPAFTSAPSTFTTSPPCPAVASTKVFRHAFISLPRHASATNHASFSLCLNTSLSSTSSLDGFAPGTFFHWLLRENHERTPSSQPQ